VIELLRAWLLSIEPWGTATILWAQSWSTPLLDRFFHVSAFLGDEGFFFVLLPLVYWCINKRAGRWLAYGLLLSLYANSFIKHIFMISRPSDPRIRIMRPVDPPNPNFPSGHAQNSAVMWGFVASRLRRTLLWVLAALLVLFTSFSRIYLGVHDPPALIGGWVCGAIILVLFLWGMPHVERWLGRRPLWIKLLLIVALPVAGLLLHRADLRGLYPAPDAASIAGAFLGVSLGFLFEPRCIGFGVEGPWWQRLIRLVVGLAIVAVFWQGPKLFLPDEMAHGLAMLLRFLRYALAGLAAILLLPWLFVRLHLAPREAERSVAGS